MAAKEEGARAHACLLQRMPINALFPPSGNDHLSYQRQVCLQHPPAPPPSRSILALLQSEPTHTRQAEMSDAITKISTVS